FFQSEKNIFNEVARQLELNKVGPDAFNRHPLAFLVEAADDICYSIIDLEDGCSLGLVSYDEAKNLFEGVITKNKSKLGKLNSINSKAEKIGFLRALAIGDLMNECCTLFLDNENQILSGTFDQALADHCPSKEALKQIIDVSIEKIYRARQVVEIEASGHAVLPGLLEEFLQAGQHLTQKNPSRKYANLAMLLPEDIIHNIQQDPTPYYVARNIVDFISGLTDRHAIGLFKKIKGFAA
ncbi:MAG TPA: dGTPase, partial [Cyclobacteriaceae bacterium]